MGARAGRVAAVDQSSVAPSRLMLAGVAAGRMPQPEWAARLPVFVLTCIASHVLYRAVAGAFGTKRPTPLYYYRELQSLRDPLHFRAR